MRDGWAQTTFGEVLARSTARLGDRPEPRILTVTEGHGLVDQVEHWGRRVATQDLSGYKVVQPNDVVYNIYLLWNGAIGQNLFSDVGVTSPVYEVFTPKEQVDPRVLGLILQSPQMLAAFDSISIGTIPRRRRAPWQDFLALPVLLPPLAEQRRIVDLIGAVDDAIEAAVLTAASLEEAWWAATRAIEAHVAGGSTQQLSEISEIHGGLTKNKKDAERPDAAEAPYLRVANVHRRRLNLDEMSTIIAPKARIEAAQLLPGDLLMNEGGDRDKLGRGSIWRGQIEGCTHQNHVFRVRITDDQFVPEFVSAWANSFGQKWFAIHGAQTTGIASISKSTLSRFPVPDVPRGQQKVWAEALDGLTEREFALKDQVTSLRALRSNLLTALLSGGHEIPASYDELLEVAS